VDVGIQFLLMLWLATSTAVGQEEMPAGPPTLDIATLNLSTLSAWRTQTYRSFNEVFRRYGTVQLVTEIEQDFVRFRDVRSFICEGESIQMTMESVHRNDPTLTLVELSGSIEMEPERWCDLGKGSTRFPVLGTDEEAPAHGFTLEPGVLTGMVLFRLVTLLPKEAGRAWLIPSLVTFGSMEGTGYLLTCLGTESAIIEGDQTELTWYRLVRQDDVKVSDNLEFWVDEQGHLARWAMGSRDIAIRVSEEP